MRTTIKYPGVEYKYLSYFFSNILTVTRISLGDFDFSPATKLDPFYNIIFWIIWFMIVLFTCIVFLNFVIAEVQSSYQSVKENIDGLILKEKASLIKESEDLMPKREKKNKKLFPKYLIMRETEEEKE